MCIKNITVLILTVSMLLLFSCGYTDTKGSGDVIDNNSEEITDSDVIDRSETEETTSETEETTEKTEENSIEEV